MTFLLTLFGGKRGLIWSGIFAAILIVLGLYAGFLKAQNISLESDLKDCQTEQSRLTGELKLQNKQIEGLNNAGVQAQQFIAQQQELLKTKQAPIEKIVIATAGQSIDACKDALPQARQIISEMRKAK